MCESLNWRKGIALCNCCTVTLINKLRGRESMWLMPGHAMSPFVTETHSGP